MREVDADRPLFIKVSPDLETTALVDVVDVAREAKATGIIATNTTISRDIIPPGARHSREGGGLSGRPLKEMSDQVLRHFYRLGGDDLILIGVGGIFDGDDLYDKIAAGAHLCQVYTGWVYGGPNMVPDALEQLANRMVREGIKSLAELRGSACRVSSAIS
jgi:dihydroorotate dehydrogenase